MINKIKEKINLNEKVYIELVDPNGLRDRGDFQESLIQDLLDSDKLQVLDVDLGVHDNLVKVRLHDSCRAILIDEENLVFFEMVPDGATFDDLVDVVVQAAKDGLLEINMLNSEFITASIPGDHDSAFVTGWRTKPEVFESSINKVESLYTEKFVIDDIESLQKVKIGASGVLANGSKFKVHAHGQYSGKGKLYIEFESETTNHASLEVLKGATVTQKKD